MRSPGVMSFCTIKDPPAKIVPRTKPGEKCLFILKLTRHEYYSIFVVYLTLTVQYDVRKTLEHCDSSS